MAAISFDDGLTINIDREARPQRNNNGRFIKMRGPSDSGKQNGFVASQWEMFRSKQLDTIVVKIFNAYLLKYLHYEANYT